MASMRHDAIRRSQTDSNDPLDTPLDLQLFHSRKAIEESDLSLDLLGDWLAEIPKARGAPGPDMSDSSTDGDIDCSGTQDPTEPLDKTLQSPSSNNERQPMIQVDNTVGDPYTNIEISHRKRQESGKASIASVAESLKSQQLGGDILALYIPLHNG